MDIHTTTNAQRIFKRLMSREQVMAGRMNPSDFEETVLERI